MMNKAKTALVVFACVLAAAGLGRNIWPETFDGPAWDSFHPALLVLMALHLRDDSKRLDSLEAAERARSDARPAAAVDARQAARG